MSEQFPIHPDQIDPAVITTELLQQNAIRELAEGRIGSTPMDEVARADMEAKNFGLEAGVYEVYRDKESPFGGGFKKFVSKEDPTDTLVGISWAHISGNMSSPDRYVSNYALRPNGDIVGKVSVENAANPTVFKEYALSAGSSDPKIAAQYAWTLGLMHDKAQKAVSPPVEAARSDSTAVREAVPRADKGFLSKWLGRFSFR